MTEPTYPQWEGSDAQLHWRGRVKAEARLKKIAEIIEAVDNRCAAADGPVTPTLQEMRQDEISHIYRLAMGEDDEDDDD